MTIFTFGITYVVLLKLNKLRMKRAGRILAHRNAYAILVTKVHGKRLLRGKIVWKYTQQKYIMGY
jgi:uncharacterized C2H2 Zn-finger protein